MAQAIASPGRFISVEGIEGAGKSKLIQALGEALRARGLSVCLTREPGGTPVAERLRDVVLERGTETIPSVAETLLMFAARSIHLHNCIQPALARGAWVLCDRFTDATRAYQGAGRGVAVDLIASLAEAVHGDLWPDLTLLLDLPVVQGMSRVASRRGPPDRIESETLAFFERVRIQYLQIARDEPQRVKVLDATQPHEAVLQSSLQLLRALGL